MTLYPVLVVVTALTRWQQLHLHANCHAGSWSASSYELQLIREHLGDVWLASHREPSALVEPRGLPAAHGTVEAPAPPIVN